MSEELKQYLLRDAYGLTDEVIGRILSFYEIILRENELQNLTRLTSPLDFYYGNVVDVLELLKINQVKYPALDLGSGVGIPGILAALVRGDEWVLAESEKRKAEYLERALDLLGLKSHVKVAPIRAEAYLKMHSVQSIMARAVGPVERIYSWIQKCSTWNSLVLFKGPSWEEEWKAFQQTRFRKELILEAEHFYTVGPEQKKRCIVQLRRILKNT